MNEPTKENIIYVDLVPSKLSSFIQLVIPKCPVCKNKHLHGIGEGWRVSHCFDKQTGRSISGMYYLKVDWTIPEHAALKNRYEKLLRQAGVES